MFVQYRSRPISIDEEQIEKHEEIFDEAEDAERSEYNFAFFMIVFIFIFTGGYYAYSKIKEKFYPQSVSQYVISKKWRYWDLPRSANQVTEWVDDCFGQL